MVIRPATDPDWGFIVTSFLSSFREASTHAEDLTGKQVVSLLTNLISNGWSCTVAEMDGVIAGWVVFDKGQRLAWVFTRAMFRRQGLAKLLITRAGIDMARGVYSPFLPNRLKEQCPLKLKIHHRPFLTVPRNTLH
jgi:hypothetical protein